VTNDKTFHDAFHVPAGGWARAAQVFGVVGAAGLALAGAGFAVDREQFFHSWLTAFLFYLTLALGALFFVMVQHLARAGWSVAVRRLAETAAAALPVFALLFLPVLAGLADLFSWTDGEKVAHDHLLQHKQGYLNVPFFVARAVLYFAVWTLLARFFHRTSVAQDASRDPRLTVTMQRRAAPAMIVYAFTVTFMAFDWVMSMDPHWYSTIFGVYVWAGGVVASYAFLTLAARAVARAGYLHNVLRTDHYQDLGRLLFAFSVFWAYIGFSQFFLIWYGNIPEETIWYLHRMEGSWLPVTFFLATGHFVVPFVLLMSRFAKRRPAWVAGLAAWILVMHYLDLHWLVMPNLHPEGIVPHWIDLACLAGIGGAFLFVFTRTLAGRALVPAGDPRLPESLALEHVT
jgi:hypothetical protein